MPLNTFDLGIEVYHNRSRKSRGEHVNPDENTPVSRVQTARFGSRYRKTGRCSRANTPAASGLGRSKLSLMMSRPAHTRLIALAVVCSAWTLQAQPTPKVTSPKEALGFNVG